MKFLISQGVAKRLTKESLSDEDLFEAVDRAERGHIDAELGKNLIKQRLARRGRGRSGGYRSIIYYKRGEIAVALHIFAKNERANLTKVEQAAYQEFADTLASLTDEQFDRLVAERGWSEYKDEQPEEDVPK